MLFPFRTDPTRITNRSGAKHLRNLVSDGTGGRPLETGLNEHFMGEAT